MCVLLPVLSVSIRAESKGVIAFAYRIAGASRGGSAEEKGGGGLHTSRVPPPAAHPAHPLDAGRILIISNRVETFGIASRFMHTISHATWCAEFESRECYFQESAVVQGQRREEWERRCQHTTRASDVRRLCVPSRRMKTPSASVRCFNRLDRQTTQRRVAPRLAANRQEDTLSSLVWSVWRSPATSSTRRSFGREVSPSPKV